MECCFISGQEEFDAPFFESESVWMIREPTFTSDILCSNTFKAEVLAGRLVRLFRKEPSQVLSSLYSLDWIAGLVFIPPVRNKRRRAQNQAKEVGNYIFGVVNKTGHVFNLLIDAVKNGDDVGEIDLNKKINGSKPLMLLINSLNIAECNHSSIYLCFTKMF